MIIWKVSTVFRNLIRTVNLNCIFSRTMAESCTSSNIMIVEAGGSLSSLGKKYRCLLGKKKYVLIDLSGTLHIEDEVTPNAIEALQWLRIAGLRIKFLTNTTKESKRVLHERLTRIGFDLSPTEIFTSLIAARTFIEKHGLRPHYLVHESAMEDFEGIRTDNPNAVVIGLSPAHFEYTSLDKSFRMLLEGAQLIAIHKGRYYRRSDGLSLGPGPFVHALEFAAGITAVIVGKPYKEFFDAALNTIDCRSVKEAVMIGDDVRDDVVGALKTGVTGILVRTGKYQEGDEEIINQEEPSLVIDNFSEAVKCILAAIAAENELEIEGCSVQELALQIKYMRDGE